MRHRVKQSISFNQRLADEAERFRKAAEELPPGTARELLMKRVRQAEAALQINDWLATPGRSPAICAWAADRKATREIR
ncbi:MULTISPECIES: hypothetical protein [Bradyrhizobium]|uniref:Uncharacterized protein n=1 Tax=Bradyrhizobium vignae TaxID=1549949 RepID=A0ABS4A813_9BRAD|nr:hypothetical protein [Bradyrhizobium vignae]MBP0116552.1 hypothetical protein [Bradyrhizobium vignae]